MLFPHATLFMVYGSKTQIRLSLHHFFSTRRHITRHLFDTDNILHIFRHSGAQYHILGYCNFYRKYIAGFLCHLQISSIVPYRCIYSFAAIPRIDYRSLFLYIHLLPFKYWHFPCAGQLMFQRIPSSTVRCFIFFKKKDSHRTAAFLGEGIFTMGYSKNYI